MFFLACSFLFYIIDVGLDIWVAVEYHIADREGTDPFAKYYLGATLFFIIAPSIVLNLVSWLLYTWGWMIYRNKKLKQFCKQRMEEMKYVLQSKQRHSRSDSIVLVQGIQVINWSKKGTHKRERSRTFIGTTEMVNLADRRALPPREDTTTIHLKVSSPDDTTTMHISPVSPGHQQRKGSTSPILSDTDDDDLFGNEPDSGLEFYPLDLFDSCEYLAVSLLHLCLLGYMFRVIRLIYTSRRDKYSFDRYRDISFLRLIESFLESAPQTVLQLYLLVVHQEAVLWYRIVTPISIVVSVCSLALSVGDYISAAKDINYYDPPPQRERKPRLSWLGYLTIIFWHLFMIVARALSFSLFATIYGAYVFLIVGLHYLAMVYWVYWQNAHVFKHRVEDLGGTLVCSRQTVWKLCLWPCKKGLCANYGIEFIVAAFNIFFHFKIRDGGFITTLVPFYMLSFIENAIMILLWFFGRDYSVFIWYVIPAVVTVFAAFIVGIVLMVLYYLCFQPGKKESLEPLSDLDHPTMTSTLNRMYARKEERGNFFKRLCKLERQE